MSKSLLLSAIEEYLLDHHPSWKVAPIMEYRDSDIWIDNASFTKHIVVYTSKKTIVSCDHHYSRVAKATYDDTNVLDTITSIILFYDTTI